MAIFNTDVALDMSCTERELRRWLQMIASIFPMVSEESSCADFTIEGGTARIAWKPMPDRVIALIRLSRMEVVLAFSEGVSADARAQFSKQFQMYTLRGGG
ncbi:hypothetical protein [Limnobacter parvus]|uniref:PH domain-containing protein n=1 Tax=Limnobacter parvus TaxID=2939690 RepID=A0ABT1XDX7_9BURK|nr:hypothetical protein [Limnobacter parvus]MCR2745491.1 hypothetical protein [Limnobacter parvus]